MSEDLLLALCVVVPMLLGFMGVGALVSEAWWWAITWLAACAMSLVILSPMAMEADRKDDARRDAKQQQTCAPYGGVGTTFGDETGSGKSRVYHRLYMCKEGPRVIYEW
jgi:hypothetical protein